MDVLYSRFPGGRAGLALLLLRLVTGAGLIGEAMGISTPIAPSPEPTSVVLMSVVLVCTAMLLIIGLRTSVAGGVAGLCTVAAMVYASRHLDLIGSNADASFYLFALLLFIATSLALLGPGSYSLDARLSGWRTIRVSPVKADGPDQWETWA